MAEHAGIGSEEQPLTLLERSAEAVAQCDELIEHFNQRADRSKWLYDRLRYSTIVLTVAVASIAAVDQVPRWAVAVVSGAAALCTALLTATRPQEIWLQSRGTQQRLTAERFLFRQCAGPYAVDDADARVRLFAEQVMVIWNAGHTRWEHGRHDAANQPLTGKT